MPRGSILYRGIWLAPGSDSHRLHQEGNFAALKALLTRLEKEELERQK